MEYIVKKGQNIIDIAVQLFGTASAAFDLALQNNLSLTDDLVANNVITYDNSGQKNTKNIINYYTNNKIVPATALKTYVSNAKGIFDYTFDFSFE